MGDLGKGEAAEMKSCVIIACVVATVLVSVSSYEEVDKMAEEASPVPEQEMISAKAEVGHRGCQHRCRVNVCSVTVFQHCNYGGYRINLPPGRYGMNDLIRRGMRNDDLSSVQVHGHCTATMYEHAWFNGGRMVKTGNDNCFTNDRLRMIQLPSGEKPKMSKDFQIVVEETNPDSPTEEEMLVQTKASWGRRRRRRYVSWNDQISSIGVANRGTSRHCWWDCRERDAKNRERSSKAHERSHKERVNKERSNKERANKERTNKERSNKERSHKERVNKERNNKERSRKEQLQKAERRQKYLRERAIKLHHERTAKANERRAKERSHKERTSKERTHKERTNKERNNKERTSKERTAKERSAKERVSKERKNKERYAKERSAKERSYKKRERANKERANKERSKKEKAAKERNAKERERANKERSWKERRNKERNNKERSSKEAKAKEKAAKKKAEKDAKAKREKQAKKDEKIAKERTKKERSLKSQIAAAKRAHEKARKGEGSAKKECKRKHGAWKAKRKQLVAKYKKAKFEAKMKKALKAKEIKKKKAKALKNMPAGKFKFSANPCIGGSGKFSQYIKMNKRISIGTIPANQNNVEIYLKSSKDVDVELWDVSGKKSVGVIAWNGGRIDSAVVATTMYKGATITYSGYNGVASGKHKEIMNLGHEFIKFKGKSKVPLVMKAFGFAAGKAKVTYRWGADKLACAKENARKKAKHEKRAKERSKKAREMTIKISRSTAAAAAKLAKRLGKGEKAAENRIKFNQIIGQKNRKKCLRVMSHSNKKIHVAKLKVKKAVAKHAAHKKASKKKASKKRRL